MSETDVLYRADLSAKYRQMSRGLGEHMDVRKRSRIFVAARFFVLFFFAAAKLPEGYGACCSHVQRIYSMSHRNPDGIITGGYRIR